MKQREILILSIGIFFTIIAWMVIDIYHSQNKEAINKQVGAIGTMRFSINDNLFKTLKEKNP